jgi:hypothetical protein
MLHSCKPEVSDSRENGSRLAFASPMQTHGGCSDLLYLGVIASMLRMVAPKEIHQEDQINTQIHPILSS